MATNLMISDEQVEQIAQLTQEHVIPHLQFAINRIIDDNMPNLSSLFTSPDEMIKGKTISESIEALEQYRAEINATIHPIVHEVIINHLIKTHSTPETFDDEPREFEPSPPTTFAQAQADKPSNDKPTTMPISTIRQIIIDRVPDETITNIVFMAAAGSSAEKIREDGINLDTQIIQVIIDDNEHRIKGAKAALKREDSSELTGNEIQPQPINDYTKREVKRLYKKGHTVEFIMSETGLAEHDVIEMTDPITMDDVFPTLTSLAIMKSMDEKGQSVNEIVKTCHIRAEVVSQYLNGSQ